MAIARPVQAASRRSHAEATVEALLAALELRHIGTAHHARRVAELALALTRSVEPCLRSRAGLRDGYLLHDIGKLGLPDAILLKPGRLDAAERRIIEMHPSLGEGLTRSLPALAGCAHDVVGCHHERWDGRGYPRGLRGEETPVAARIFAVVDAFDAMTHPRPYREPVSPCAASAELERAAGTQFDPRIVDAFLALEARRRRGA